MSFIISVRGRSRFDSESVCNECPFYENTLNTDQRSLISCEFTRNPLLRIFCLVTILMSRMIVVITFQKSKDVDIIYRMFYSCRYCRAIWNYTLSTIQRYLRWYLYLISSIHYVLKSHLGSSFERIFSPSSTFNMRIKNERKFIELLCHFFSVVKSSENSIVLIYPSLDWIRQLRR